MSRKSKKQRGKPKLNTTRGAWLPQRVRYLLAGLAAAGCALTAWLLFSRLTGGVLPYCTQDSACDLVRSSQWSTLLGLPLSFWGFVSYLAIGLSVWYGRRPTRSWNLLWTLSLVALAVSLYMTWISVTRIQAVCPYCLTSLGLVITIFVTVALNRPTHLSPRRWSYWTALGMWMIIIAVLLHLHYMDFSGRPVGENEDPELAALAVHLKDTGARFYGSSLCPHCDRQKSLFGASMDRLPYVECTPQGRRGSPAMTCRAAGVARYPTWIIDGNRYVRVLTPEQLAEYSDFEWEESPAP